MSGIVDEQPQNVVLLTVDCLRFDTALEYLESAFDDSMECTWVDCFCTGSGTPTSMPGLMQSRLPTDHGGTAEAHPLVADVPTIAEVLSEEDFSCGGWHSNVYTSEEYGYERGFDEFVDLTADRAISGEEIESSDSASVIDYARSITERLGVERSAERVYSYLKRLGIVESRPHSPAVDVVDNLVSWLESSDNSHKQFAWGHFMDLHSPYLPPQRYREAEPDCPTSEWEVWRLNDKLRLNPSALEEAETQSLHGLYRANARYATTQIRRLVSELKNRDQWKNTLFLVTSDHGELFGDASVPDDISVEHPNYLTELVTRVPLVLAGGVTTGTRVSGIASGMDVAPTIVDAVGGATPEHWEGVILGSDAFKARDRVFSVTGRGMRQDNERSDLIPPDALHAAVRTGENAVLWWSGDYYGPEVYTRTEKDTGIRERRSVSNVDDSRDQLLNAIEKRFAEEARRFRASGSDEARLDEDTKARLRELGYLE